MTVCDELFDTSYAKFSQEIIEENCFKYYLYGYCKQTFSSINKETFTTVSQSDGEAITC